MNNAIDLNIKGIKCDAKDCDYNDMTVKVDSYKEWLNKPCPKCGTNLLTQADYDNTLLIIQLTEMMNRILPERKDDDEIVKATLEMDGTGKMDLKIKE
jgi:hypothetical protein